MRCERAGSLARHLCVIELDASWTASVQGFERTLDDSANRRIAIPEAFLCADAILQIVDNVASGLVVHEAVIRARLERALPFLVTEQVLIAGVRKGGDRQELHERIRVHAMAARERLDAGAEDNDFFQRVAEDPEFGLSLDELDALSRAEDLTGRCAVQVERYVSQHVAPLLEGYSGSEAPELRV
jgi:adenylosuccinate lyase